MFAGALEIWLVYYLHDNTYILEVVILIKMKLHISSISISKTLRLQRYVLHIPNTVHNLLSYNEEKPNILDAKKILHF